MRVIASLFILIASLFIVSPANAQPASPAPAIAPITAPTAQLTYDSPTVTTSPAPAPQVQVPTTPAPEAGVRCEEDMPCWNCETMGNLQCGPIVSDDQPANCEEDEPCWDCATMGNLQCGPDATMEEDAIGSFVSQTGMETTNEALTLTLEYVATTTLQPVELPTGTFAIPSSNLDNTWHILKWEPFTHA